MHKTNTAARPLEVLTLGLEGEIFAIDTAGVREILELVPVTEVPNARRFVGGLINVRGKVVPLIDPCVLFGMACTPPTVDTRIVVIEVELGGEPTLVGLLADKVYEVTDLAPASIEGTPRIGMRWRPDLIRCIGRRRDDFVIVINVDCLLSAEPLTRATARPAA